MIPSLLTHHYAMLEGKCTFQNNRKRVYHTLSLPSICAGYRKTSYGLLVCIIDFTVSCSNKSRINYYESKIFEYMKKSSIMKTEKTSNLIIFGT